ncbi:MAG: helix-turn-helix domain-containing protein, partial [Candidatus Omnitrophota bacterium]
EEFNISKITVRILRWASPEQVRTKVLNAIEKIRKRTADEQEELERIKAALIKHGGNKSQAAKESGLSEAQLLWRIDGNPEEFEGLIPEARQVRTAANKERSQRVAKEKNQHVADKGLDAFDIPNKRFWKMSKGKREDYLFSLETKRHKQENELKVIAGLFKRSLGSQTIARKKYNDYRRKFGEPPISLWTFNKLIGKFDIQRITRAKIKLYLYRLLEKYHGSARLISEKLDVDKGYVDNAIQEFGLIRKRDEFKIGARNYTKDKSGYLIDDFEGDPLIESLNKIIERQFRRRSRQGLKKTGLAKPVKKETKLAPGEKFKNLWDIYIKYIKLGEDNKLTSLGLDYKQQQELKFEKCREISKAIRKDPGLMAIPEALKLLKSVEMIGSITRMVNGQKVGRPVNPVKVAPVIKKIPVALTGKDQPGQKRKRPLSEENQAYLLKLQADFGQDWEKFPPHFKKVPPKTAWGKLKLRQELGLGTGLKLIEWSDQKIIALAARRKEKKDEAVDYTSKILARVKPLGVTGLPKGARPGKWLLDLLDLPGYFGIPLYKGLLNYIFFGQKKSLLGRLPLIKFSDLILQRLGFDEGARMYYLDNYHQFQNKKERLIELARIILKEDYRGKTIKLSREDGDNILSLASRDFSGSLKKILSQNSLEIQTSSLGPILLNDLLNIYFNWFAGVMCIEELRKEYEGLAAWQETDPEIQRELIYNRRIIEIMISEVKEGGFPALRYKRLWDPAEKIRIEEALSNSRSSVRAKEQKLPAIAASKPEALPVQNNREMEYMMPIPRSRSDNIPHCISIPEKAKEKIKLISSWIIFWREGKLSMQQLILNIENLAKGIINEIPEDKASHDKLKGIIALAIKILSGQFTKINFPEAHRIFTEIYKERGFKDAYDSKGAKLEELNAQLKKIGYILAEDPLVKNLV